MAVAVDKEEERHALEVAVSPDHSASYAVLHHPLLPLVTTLARGRSMLQQDLTPAVAAAVDREKERQGMALWTPYIHALTFPLFPCHLGLSYNKT